MCCLSVASLLVCALLLVVVPYGASIQVTRSYQSKIAFHDTLIDKFGLAVGGLVEIEYKVVTTSRDETYSGDVVLLLITDLQQLVWYSNAETISTLCSQPSMFRRELRGQGREAVIISPDIRRNLFSAYLLQCRASSDPVEISVTATMRNPRPNSSEYSHKSIKDVSSLQLLEGRVIVYALLVLGLLGQLHFCRSVSLASLHV